jgi:hypothetical protein
MTGRRIALEGPLGVVAVPRPASGERGHVLEILPLEVRTDPP